MEQGLLPLEQFCGILLQPGSIHDEMMESDIFWLADPGFSWFDDKKRTIDDMTICIGVSILQMHGT